ncbi:RING-type domain-containing protein [Pleurotus pulmonarius]
MDQVAFDEEDDHIVYTTFQTLNMFRILALMSLAGALFLRARSSPIATASVVPFSSKSDRTWLWGWAWGSESTVSVVDRTPVVSWISRPAAFGAELGNPLLGYVIPISSFTEPCAANESYHENPKELNWGCPSLCVTGPHQPEPAETWIALVQRGGCEFVHKVREAQRLGAKAVVVGGNDPDVSGYPDTLVNMYSQEDASDIKIASTFIKHSAYMELSSLIATSNTSHSGLPTLSLLITAEYSAWEWYSPVITFVIILLLPSILTFITLLVHRIRAARAAQLDRAPEEVVLNLPWKVWTGNGWEKHEGPIDPPQSVPPSKPSADVPAAAISEEAAEEATGASSSTSNQANQPWFEQQMECAICLSQFEKGDRVRVLPCHHIFHLDEVDEWLIQRKKLCPVCKADVTKPPPDDLEVHPHATSATEPEVQEPPPTERTPLINDRS